MAEPNLGSGLGLDDALYLLLSHAELSGELLESGNLLLDCFAAFPEFVELCRSLQDWGERPQVVRGGFGADDQRLERGGDISATRVDGDHRVVIAATTFQEADHWRTPKIAHGVGRTIGPELLAISDPARGEDWGKKADAGLTATRVPRYVYAP